MWNDQLTHMIYQSIFLADWVMSSICKELGHWCLVTKQMFGLSPHSESDALTSNAKVCTEMALGLDTFKHDGQGGTGLVYQLSKCPYPLFDWTLHSSKNNWVGFTCSLVGLIMLGLLGTWQEQLGNLVEHSNPSQFNPALKTCLVIVLFKHITACACEYTINYVFIQSPIVFFLQQTGKVHPEEPQCIYS